MAREGFDDFDSRLKQICFCRFQTPILPAIIIFLSDKIRQRTGVVSGPEQSVLQPSGSREAGEVKISWVGQNKGIRVDRLLYDRRLPSYRYLVSTS
jgi:hypothetical protein